MNLCGMLSWATSVTRTDQSKYMIMICFNHKCFLAGAGLMSYSQSYCGIKRRCQALVRMNAWICEIYTTTKCIYLFLFPAFRGSARLCRGQNNFLVEYNFCSSNPRVLFAHETVVQWIVVMLRSIYWIYWRTILQTRSPRL